MKTVSIRSFWYRSDIESFRQDHQTGSVCLTGYSARYCPDDPTDNSDLTASADDVRKYTGKSALTAIERAAFMLLNSDR